jgi:hypothetical protein
MYLRPSSDGHLIIDARPQVSKRGVMPRSGRPGGDAEDVRNLGQGYADVVVQDDHRAVIGRQRPNPALP